MPSLSITICLSSHRLKYSGSTGIPEESGNHCAFPVLSPSFKGIQTVRFRDSLNSKYMHRQIHPLMVINPSMILVKVLRISNPVTNTSNGKKDMNVPHNMIWDLHIRHLSFLLSFLHSASLRLTSAMISRLDCLLLFFSAFSCHLFFCHSLFILISSCICLKVSNSG